MSFSEIRMAKVGLPNRRQCLLMNLNSSLMSSVSKAMS